MSSERVQHAFQDEVFFGLRQQRNRWMLIAIVSLCVALCSIVAFVAILPLKETVPFVVMVDRTTGEAEKIVRVRPTTLTEQEAVLQAELVSYITDRETYDVADNATRIPFVLKRSNDQAADGLRLVWSAGSEEYPPNLYGTDIRILVRILSISPQPGTDIAQVRFKKIRERSGEKNVERSFVATVGYKFEPRTERNLQELWKNPLGFSVTSYRVDQETLSN